MLVCDDEPHVVAVLRVLLGRAGYEVLGAGSIAQALTVAGDVDAAIVDLLLPDGSGTELCERLRAWSTMPILVLSGLDEEAQKVAALQAGADDYLTKPFSGRELLARLRALMRRGGGREQALVITGSLRVDLVARHVELSGREVALTPTEFAILAALMRERGRLVRTEHLIEEVWGTETADAGLLRTHLANLRGKLEPGARGGGYSLIRTEPGLGYRFAG